MFEVQILGKVPYQETWEKQKQWVRLIDQEHRPDQLLLLEHTHTITQGRGSRLDHYLLDAKEYARRGIEVVEIDRGGDLTYHGPGQLVAYPLFYLGRQGNARQYLRKLEAVIIDVLSYWGITGERKEGYTGVWIGNQKVAAIGIKFNRARARQGYITSHGFALNVNPDLSYFQTIVPCGISQYGVTSIAKQMGEEVSMKDAMDQVIIAMKRHFD